jgi:peptide/nickel transport system permease protein
MREPDAIAVVQPGWRRVHLSGLTLVGGSLVLLWVLVALFAPLLAPHDPDSTNLGALLKPPLTPGHLLGTDQLGRDVLSRIIYGTRVDLSMGLIGVMAPFTIGITLGVISGYVGGKLDTLLMRLVDVALAFPFLVLVLAILAVRGPGLGNYYISLAIVAWVPYARMVRAETLVLKHSEFVEAARLLGFSGAYVMRKHVLPNAVTPAAVFVITDIVLTILLGSGLSFFGLGAQPPTAEWGRMIAEGQAFLATAWWISVLPGVALLLLTLGFALLGDGIAKEMRVRT